MLKLIRRLFWALFLIALGLVLVSNAALGTDFPVVRPFAGILVIWWGVSLILGGFRSREELRRRVEARLAHKAGRFAHRMGR